MIKDKQKGFTLVEMLVTITVLGIVTVIALPIINVVSRQLNNKKLDVYENTIESGAKVYTDSHDLDLFGYQTVGCVDIYYNTLVSNKVIDELDFSNQKVITDKIFVRVKKINDNYSYETYLPTNDNIGDINFSLCDGTISDSGPAITFTPNGTTKYQKSATTTIKINDMFGISPNAKISYQWFYTNGTPIGTAVTKEFKNGVVDSLSVNVNTPTGLNGKIKLVVTPLDLVNEISMVTTDSVQSEEFKLDNIAPVINIDAYQASGSNKTGGILKSANNSNLVINEWKKHGYYFDFNRSTDNVGIAKEEWAWNTSGKSTLDTALSSGYHSYTPITNHTLTASGVRYGSLKLCDEANNCTTKTVQVSVSNKYTINYDANGGNGSVASTTCYYGFGCNLSNNSFTRDHYEFSGWKIDNKDYGVGANLANFTTVDGKTYTAYAQWKKMTYLVTIGDNGSPSSQTVEKNHGEPLKLPRPSRPGYSLVGYNTDPNAHSSIYNDWYNSDAPITIYPIWKKNDGYTIRYHRDKAGWFNDWTDGETCHVWNQESSCSVTVDGIPRLNTWSDTTPSYNYDWILNYQGWNWNPGYWWRDFYEGQTISISNSIDLYAVITLTDGNKRFRVNNTSSYQRHLGLKMRYCASPGCDKKYVMHDGATFQVDNDLLGWVFESNGWYLWLRGHQTGDGCNIDTEDWPVNGWSYNPYSRNGRWGYTLLHGRGWYDHCACNYAGSSYWNDWGWDHCYSENLWSTSMYLYPI